MNKNIALLALTGVLTLASCGQGGLGNNGGTNSTTYALTVSMKGATGTVTVKDSAGKTVGTVTADGGSVNLASGTYTLSAGAVTGFTAPADQTVTINGANANATVTYTATTGGGGTTTPVTQAVTINLAGGVTSAPVTIKDANGAVVGGYDAKTTTNGTTVNLPAGTYTVTAGTVSGYKAPTAATVVVGSSATSVNLAYAKVIATDVGLNAANADSKLLTIEQNVNGTPTVITYAKGTLTIVPNANSGAERYEVFLSSTTNDLNAQNRIYDSRDPNSGSLNLNTANLRQGEMQYIIVRYWTGNSNTTATTVIVPDNLGPQVPDVIPVTKLSPALTQQKGNWVNGTVKLSFQNVDTLRDNPNGTTVMPSGVDHVVWYADSNARNGMADMSTSTAIGTSYASPYEVSVDTTKLKDGTYDIFAVAYDVLGNMSIIKSQNLFVLNVDNTGPVNGAGSFTAVDAGTGAVKDEFQNGGIDANYARRVNSCMVDAFGAKAGNIDLFDSMTTVSGRLYVSGLAHVTSLNYGAANDTGVGISGNNTTVNVDGQPITGRLYKLVGSTLVPWGNAPLTTITATDCVYMDVNGLDAGEVKVVFSSDASTDLLGNPATGIISPASIFVDNQRPNNLRFTKVPARVAANGQGTLEAVADDSLSGLYSAPQFFGRDTNGTSFSGRAVQLAQDSQTNFRFFHATSGKMDVIATVRDYAGNVSSYTSAVAVDSVGPQLVTLNNDNLFVRRQQANGNFLNFGVATDENPVTGPVGSVHALDLLNSGRSAIGFAPANVLQAGFYQEVLASNPLNRIGKGTADLGADDLNKTGAQNLAPLFLIAATESAPYAAIKNLEGGLYSYHGSIIDKNGWVSEAIHNIQY